MLFTTKARGEAFVSTFKNLFLEDSRCQDSSVVRFLHSHIEDHFEVKHSAEKAVNIAYVRGRDHRGLMSAF